MSFTSRFKIYAIKIGKLSRLAKTSKQLARILCVFILHYISSICCSTGIYYRITSKYFLRTIEENLTSWRYGTSFYLFSSSPVIHFTYVDHISNTRRTNKLKDRVQFSILNFGKVIKQRERKRAGERGESAWRGGWGRLARRRPCVRWRQAAFSHSLNRGTELGSSASYLVPYASCPASLCLVLLCFCLLAFLACCDFLPCSRITLPTANNSDNSGIKRKSLASLTPSHLCLDGEINKILCFLVWKLSEFISFSSRIHAKN